MAGLIRVSLVSRADAGGGGASRVADDIFTGLQGSEGLEPRRYAGELHHKSAIRYGHIVDRRRNSLSFLSRRLDHSGYVDHFPIELLGLNKDISASDIVHAHDISTVMSPSTLDRLARRKWSVFWTLHDMSPITGGCIYPIGCDNWRSGCGECPLLRTWPLNTKRDRTGFLQKKRLEILKAGRVQLISPSSWLALRIEDRVPGAKVRVIPNGVDTDRFAATAPDRRAASGNGNSIPALLFVANHLNDVRKGALYLSAIAQYLAEKGRRLRIVMVGGSGVAGKVESRGNLELHYVGRIDRPAEQNRLYGEVDGLLLPTHADNFPLVMLEALSSGRPVFAFDTGGIEEAVDDSCGAVVPAGEIGMLLDSFFRSVDMGTLPAQAIAARERAVARYSLSTFIDRHGRLYREAASAV